MSHLIQRVTILGTGLIGGSFAKALRKYTPDMHITGWDRAEVILQARKSGVIDEGFYESLEPAIRRADLIYIALPIGQTLDLLPELAHHAAAHTLVTDAGSTKQRIWQAANLPASRTPMPTSSRAQPTLLSVPQKIRTTRGSPPSSKFWKKLARG